MIICPFLQFIVSSVQNFIAWMCGLIGVKLNFSVFMNPIFCYRSLNICNQAITAHHIRQLLSGSWKCNGTLTLKGIFNV